MTPDERALAGAIGKAIAKRRATTGLTQEEVAEVLQIGSEAVSRMERGTVMPTVGRLVELAEIFQCGIGELLFEVSPQANDQSNRIANLMGGLSREDRNFVLFMVEKLSLHLSEKKAIQA